MRQRWFVVLSLWLGAGVLLGAEVRAAELGGSLSLLGQVRRGDQSRETEAPTDLYGDLYGADRRHHADLDTFFRVERDFGLGQTATDLYAAALKVQHPFPGVDFSLGRQFLSEGPGGAFVADAGKIRFDLGGPVALTVFGGQPRYFEPTFSSENLSQDEQIFGGNLRTTRWTNGFLSVGYLQQDREQHAIRQLITGAGARAFPTLPGLPNVYGSVAYDADRQNIDLGTAGVDFFLSQPRLRLNFETSYYKPQDQGNRLTTDINRREDAIFETFSLSDMLQFRTGLSYSLTRTVSAYGDYSYQRYRKLSDIFTDGHVGSAGFVWLPGGDGLEVVRVEYYVIDSGGGNVNGGKAYYESRVYQRIVFRTKIDVTYYEKESNERDTAVNGLLGLGYVLAPGLIAELDFEGNRNRRFNEDFRFGFLITYNFRYRTEAEQPQHAGWKGRS